MKKTFLGHENSLLCCMIQAENPTDALSTIAKALPDSDAFGFQQEQLNPIYRTDEILNGIFDAMGDKPAYVTNYRGGFNKGLTDEELGEGLIRLVHQGGTLCDVIGDLYCRAPMELTEDPMAIDKQKRLIERIHEAGGEVLMSSHVLKYIPAEEVVRIALAQQDRGADIVKIVTGASTEEEMLENLRITALLKKELKVPYLFLSGGMCRLHRMIGPMLGCVMHLCVEEHDALATKAQPNVHDVRIVMDHFNSAKIG